jgi:hypothetical protein
MKIGSIEIEHSVECNKCGTEVRSGSMKRLYFWLSLHLKFRCANKPKDFHLLSTLWELWNWNP